MVEAWSYEPAKKKKKKKKTKKKAGVVGRLRRKNLGALVSPSLFPAPYNL